MLTLYWMLPSMIVSSCIEKFISCCQCKASRQTVMHAAKCLQKYADLYEGFAFYVAFVFGVPQLLSILTIFSCILQGIGSIIYNDSLKLMRASGLFFISSGLILNITGLTFFIDNAYKSMNGMTISLKEQLLYERDSFDW